jgi:hypothetical protein
MIRHYLLILVPKILLKSQILTTFVRAWCNNLRETVCYALLFFEDPKHSRYNDDDDHHHNYSCVE